LEELDMFHKDTHKDFSSLLAVAIDRYGARFVSDMYNLEYDFDGAHLEGKNNLPVIVVSLPQKENRAYTVVGRMILFQMWQRQSSWCSCIIIYIGVSRVVRKRICYQKVYP